MSDKKYTVVQLKKICKDKKIKGYSKLKKQQLIKKCLDGKSSPPKENLPKEKKMTVAQLKKECKKNGIKGYSKMRKAELQKKCLKNKESPKKESPKLKMAMIKYDPLSEFSSPENTPKNKRPPMPKNLDKSTDGFEDYIKPKKKKSSPKKSSPPKSSLVTEEYEFKSDSSNKFWKITYNKNGGEYTVTFGRIGCNKCNSKTKNGSIGSIKKLINSKIKKGYKLKGSKSPEKPKTESNSVLDKFNKEFNKLKAQNKKLEAKGDYGAMDRLFSKAVRKLQPYILKAKNNVPLAKRIAEIYSKEEQTYSEFIAFGKGFENPKHDEVYDEYIAQYEQW